MSLSDRRALAASPACTLGDGGGAGIVCGGVCVDPARDHENCGGCQKACVATSACDGTCVGVATMLDGLRYEIPCVDNGSPACQNAPSPAAKTVTLTGTPAKTYLVTIRVRGIVEQKAYAGAVSLPAVGTNATFFAAGGTRSADAWNDYSLKISSPAETVRLNRGETYHTYVDPLDYTGTLTAAAGATISLEAISSDDYMARNRDPGGNAIVVPGIPPAPLPFDGQFVQVNVVSVSLAD